jgi:hypothetical protein
MFGSHGMDIKKNEDKEEERGGKKERRIFEMKTRQRTKGAI